MKNIYANELCKTHSFIARIKWNGHCNMASHTLANKNWHWWCRYQENLPKLKWSRIKENHMKHHHSFCGLTTLAGTILISHWFTQRCSDAPMVRTGTDPSSRGPEPRLCTYRVCTYRVLSQLSVSGHFIRSCLCKVAAAILVTISLPLVAIRLE